MARSLTHQIGTLFGSLVTLESLSSPNNTDAAISVAASIRKSSSTTPSLVCKVKAIAGDNMDSMLPLLVSPCLSLMRAALWVACQAFSMGATMALESEVVDEVAQEVGQLRTIGGAVEGVPVYMMMPLDSVRMDNSVNRRKAMNASLKALKSTGVEGIMMDVWCGLVEREDPEEYNWGGYGELMEIAKKHGRKVQAIMSFHQYGGNVGDSVTIPLPKWVLEEIRNDQDLAYTDQWGRRNFEYLSLGVVRFRY